MSHVLFLTRPQENGNLSKTQKRTLQRFAGVRMREILYWQHSAEAGESLIRAPGSGRPSVITDAVEIELRRIGEECGWVGTNEYYSIALAAFDFAVSTTSIQRLMERDGWRRQHRYCAASQC